MARSGPLTLAVALALAACGGEERKAAEASKRLARSFGKPPAALPAPPAAGPLASPVLYVDGSQSMAGFTNCMTSPTRYDGVMDRLMVDLGIGEVRRFGAAAGKPAVVEPVAIDRALHCPAFYAFSQNPDYQLFDAMRAERAPRVHLYLTDGVQSDFAGGNQSPSVRRLADWIGAGRALAVLAFHSQFDGRAWSETRKQWIGRARVERRPFYLFVLAPTEGAVDEVLGRLSADLRGQAQVMRFAPQGIACAPEVGSVSVLTRDKDLPWAMLTQPTTAKAATTPAAVGTYVCRLRADFPLAGVRLRVEGATYGRWNGSSFVHPTAEPAGTRLEAGRDSVAGAEVRTPLLATLPEDPSTRFGFYRVTLAAETGPLRPGIAALSTDSDADAATFARTYRFAWVVEQLARAQLARAVPPRAYAFTTFYN